jgi:hypothetical protein
MRSVKGSLVGLVLAGILALAPTAAFAHGGGGGGHGGEGAALVVAAAISVVVVILAATSVAVISAEATLGRTLATDGFLGWRSLCVR